MKPIVQLIFTCVTSAAWSAVPNQVANQATYDEWEGAELVEVLIRDGHLQDAERELKALPQNSKKHFLFGQLYLAQGEWAKALTHLDVAPVTPVAQLHRGRALYQLERHADCLKAFELSNGLWKDADADAIAMSHCARKSGKAQQALTVLTQREKREPSQAISREVISWLLELRLSLQAYDYFFQRQTKWDANMALAVAEMFLNHGYSPEALELVEIARLKDLGNLDVNLSAAQMYFQRGHIRATAEAFERAARVDAKYRYHVAEIHRQMSQFQAAIYFGQTIADMKERLKNRLALYVDRGQFTLIGSMEGLVGRSPLREDDETRYALAYSLSRQGQTESPLRYLRDIQRPELLEKATRLRMALLNSR